MIVVRPVNREWPVYWGVEHRAAGPIFDTVWMAESLPPWRRSTHAVRVRVGPKALHFGLCKVMDADDPLRGREDIGVAPEVIGEEFRRFDTERVTSLVRSQRQSEVSDGSDSAEEEHQETADTGGG